ncbi:PadR family transcriptional regulator [Clostridium sp. Marseille-P2415]|uniref:PadR family transcriptional regulator n=1 Tax=Clostridium sp. Marseille-P2415 TaxID=1805471 RepID=UPI0009886D60|nr:PadR family transcriptional regulator [Clostridium sp. Marseille-P2415]
MAKKNTLKYIILGLLEKQDLAGYDITKIFEDEIGQFWQAKHSQIYPELQKLEGAGLIFSHTEIVGNKLEKRLYTLTGKGGAELEAWIASSTPELSAAKDEFILKLYFIRSQDDERIKEMFAEQLALHAEKLNHLKWRMDSVFASPEEKEQNYGHFLILEHAIRREEGYLQWLKEVDNKLSI